jgi:beta-mannosidase
VQPRRPTDRQTKRSITGVFGNSRDLDLTWNPGGIWRPVHLERTGPVRVRHLRVRCRDATEASANVALRAVLDASAATEILLRTVVGDTEVVEQRRLAAGENQVEWVVRRRRASPVVASGARRPTAARGGGRGHPHRRRRSSRGRRAQPSGRAPHRAAPGRHARLDHHGERRAPVPEGRQPAAHPPSAGRRHRPRSCDATWSWPPRLASTCCGCRGHISRPELYDAADELGLLIWQDFPCKAATPAPSASRPSARHAKRSTCSPTTRRWPSGAATTNRSPSTTIRPSTASGQGAARPPARGPRAALVEPHHPRPHGEAHHRQGRRHPPGHRSRRGAPPPAAARRHQLPPVVRLALRRRTRPRRPRPPHAPPGALRLCDSARRPYPTTAGFAAPSAGPTSTGTRSSSATGSTWPRSPNGSRPPTTPPSPRGATPPRRSRPTWCATRWRRCAASSTGPTGGFAVHALADAHPAISAAMLDHERVPKAAWAALRDACRPVIVTADHLPLEVVVGEALVPSTCTW